MVLLPTLSDNEPDALPLVKLDQLPLLTFTPSLAFASLRVAVTVKELVALVTDAVYDVVAEAKVGDNVPELNDNDERVASDESTPEPVDPLVPVELADPAE